MEEVKRALRSTRALDDVRLKLHVTVEALDSLLRACQNTELGYGAMHSEFIRAVWEANKKTRDGRHELYGKGYSDTLKELETRAAGVSFILHALYGLDISQIKTAGKRFNLEWETTPGTGDDGSGN